jgi:phosphoglycolate phosphatase
MFALFVFDLDGTLVDSRRDIADAANALLESYGAAPLDEDRIGRMVGDGAATLVARALSARGVAQPAGALDRYLSLYNERLLAHTRPYPGIVETLDGLARRARLGVVTNKPLQPTRDLLRGLDLARFFSPDDVIGGDGPFPRKPDPAALQHIQRTHGVAATSTLFVGDSVIDWRTAHAARTPLCVARYGFGCHTIPADTLSNADHTIESPTELLLL